jgi:hypothetical protein
MAVSDNKRLLLVLEANWQASWKASIPTWHSQRAKPTRIAGMLCASGDG